MAILASLYMVITSDLFMTQARSREFHNFGKSMPTRHNHVLRFSAKCPEIWKNYKICINF